MAERTQMLIADGSARLAGNAVLRRRLTGTGVASSDVPQQSAGFGS
jgi:hypothetical protein